MVLKSEGRVTVTGWDGEKGDRVRWLWDGKQAGP